MSLIPFQDIVTERIQREPSFAGGLVAEALRELAEGEPGSSARLLNYVIVGRVGDNVFDAEGPISRAQFDQLRAGKGETKELIRLIGWLAERLDIELEVAAKPRVAAAAE